MKKNLLLHIILAFSLFTKIHAQEVFQKIITLPNQVYYNTDFNRNPVKITMDKGLLVVKYIHLKNYQILGIAVSKLDSNFNVQWSREIYTEFGGDDIRDILLTKDSGFVLAGQYSNYSGDLESRSYVKKINSKGNLVWEKSFYWKSYNAAERLAEDTKGNIIAIGNTSDDYFGYGWSVKLDTSGNILWSHVYSNSTELSFLTAITTTLDGDVVFLGHYHTNHNDNNYKLFFAKANKNGVIQQSFLLNNAYFNKVKQLPDESYILYGNRQIMKIDKNFNIVWSKQINQSTYISTEALTMDSNANLIIAGRKRELAPFENAINQIIKLNVITGNITSAIQVSNDTALVNRDIVSINDGYIIAEVLHNAENLELPSRYKVTKLNKDLSSCNLINIADTAINILLSKTERKISIIDTLKVYPATSAYVIDSTNYSIVETKCANVVLPLVLVSFTARRTGSYNTLYWATSGEQNVAAFQVQRSSNAVNFITIATINPYKNASVQNNYTYQDKSPLQANNHYRVKIIDKDGKYRYSSIKTVMGSNNFYASIYPNPVGSELRLKIKSGKEIMVRVKITDMQGRVLINNKINITQGESEQMINTSSLAKGTYIVQIISQDGQQQIKIMK